MKSDIENWSVRDAIDLYDVEDWSAGYFSVLENGHLSVHPTKDPRKGFDLKQLIDDLQLRGIDLPILLRFNGILQHQMREIHEAFQKAIRDHDYQNGYSCVYPIKVNQQRQVVEEVIRYGREYGFGLEAGSKPELLAVVAMTDAATPIICNGFKDAEFVEMAMLAQKMGRHVIPVVEKYTELDLVLKCAERVGVRPKIGMRIKLAARGAGRWQESGGNRSKFGLTVGEVLRGLAELKQREMADCFQLLHFHLGSQVTDIRMVKTALIEGARVYADLHSRGAGLQYLDVGGGLGVDYDGSQTNNESSMNYTLQEYANDVVYHIRTICDNAEVPHPQIISESGRAIAAYHSALVFGVLGVAGPTSADRPLGELSEDAPQPLLDLQVAFNELTEANALEIFHDAQQALEMTVTLFTAGYLPLEERGQAESLFWAICRRIRKLIDQLEYVPEELQKLDLLLSDTYFCNFSLFQSMPDSWAIDQLFPVMPIHRLDERPTRHAVLGDITCDSDGKIDHFIGQGSQRRSLWLHPFDGKPYYLGAFLIGAYQEILGDLHNLFGDTNAVHVRLNESGEAVLDSIIKGDTVSEVLDYVEFDRSDLVKRLQVAVENAVQQGRFDLREAGRCLKFYEEALQGYTYLEEVEGD
ncbi:MAG: biosynthetic arginine decarboxylase [Pirellulaceae bacterium]|nr:biosynthetic arginine decarboxylase [Pirellulaceae bacterium]